jgi:hypothetical protein
MMQDLEDDLMQMVQEHAPQLQTGMLLFSQRRAIARAMMKAMSDEMMKIDAERAVWDADRWSQEESASHRLRMEELA